MSQIDKLKEKEKTSYIEECIIWALKTDADKTAAISELAALRSERDALKLKYEQLEAIAADVNEWLKTSANLKGSAHQRELESALAGKE